MSHEAHVHAALAGDGNLLVCANPSCGLLLSTDVEICDECGGTQLIRLGSLQAMLCGWVDDRQVVFALAPERPNVIGRRPDSPPPDIDLGRMTGSNKVHRRHACVEYDGETWRVARLGKNPVIVRGLDAVALELNARAPLTHGDTLDISGIRLTFVLRTGRDSR